MHVCGKLWSSCRSSRLFPTPISKVSNCKFFLTCNILVFLFLELFLVYQHDVKKASAGRASVATPAATKLAKAEKSTTLPASAAQKAAAVARAELDKKKEQESLFPYSLLHLGGDEVSYTCWEQSPQVP